MIAAAACGALLALAPAARADEAPACNAEDELVSLTLPRWAHAGGTFAVSTAVTRADHVQGFAMTVDGKPVDVTLGPDGDADLYLHAPPRSGRFELTASWLQTAIAAGDAPLCRQEFVFDVQAVAPKARIGREEPRVDGRWKMTIRPLGRTPGGTQRATWRFNPNCAVGACDLTVALAGERFRLVPDAQTRYVLPPAELRPQPIACGSVRHAADAVTRHVFEVVGSQLADGVVVERATRIASRSTVTYTPTRAGRAAGCGRVVYSWSITGVRAGD